MFHFQLHICGKLVGHTVKKKKKDLLRCDKYVLERKPYYVVQRKI